MSDSTTATRAPSPASSCRSSNSNSGSSMRSRPKYRKYTSEPAEALTSWQFVPPHELPEAPDPTPVERAHKGRGLYVQLSPQPGTDAPPSYTPRPHPSARRASMVRLQNLISEAVKKAGMEGPPPSEKQGEMDHKNNSGASPEKSSSKALFRGTYGQVMTALNSRELMTTPCDEAGFDKGQRLGHNTLTHKFTNYSLTFVAKRLGVLFVVSPNETGGVEFTKLTLWG